MAADLNMDARLFSSSLGPATNPFVGEVSDDFKIASNTTDGIISYAPAVDDRLMEVFARANDPSDAIELRNLWLGRIDCESRDTIIHPDFAAMWRGSRVRRRFGPDEILNARSTVSFVKELFNSFFRDDLYGVLRSNKNILLSSGSADERIFGLPETLKDCLRFALTRDWYGYSDSRGREPVREAIALYENVRLNESKYSSANVALTMGGTFAVNSLADFILSEVAGSTSAALCAIPNYPPLVQAIARRSEVRLVPLSSERGEVSLEPLRRELRPDTPLVFLQTVINPTGAIVNEEDLAALIESASPSTLIILDECHECLGEPILRTSLRASPNVIRVSSVSKAWSAPGLKIGWILADRAFIDAYYEYASTSYGGPPSIFYTLVEVLARMERWILQGLSEPSIAELREFESTYGLDLDLLRRAYASYRHDRIEKHRMARLLRDATVGGLARSCAAVLVPRYSINVAVNFPPWDSSDSYSCFRDLLRHTSVAVFPGILTFCFSQNIVRITTARNRDDLSQAIERLQLYLASRDLGSTADGLVAQGVGR